MHGWEMEKHYLERDRRRLHRREKMWYAQRGKKKINA
jgi:hypothetical protein